VEEDSPYAILRYICHRGASGVRQMGSDILDNGCRLMGGEGNGGDRGLGKASVRLK